MNTEATALKSALSNLARVKDPDRALDVEIAVLLGWRSESEDYTNRDGERLTRHTWYNERGELDKVPRFTWNIDVALRLAERFSSEIEGGFGWEPGEASAQFMNNKPVIAATPAIAICMQALLLRLRQLEAADQGF
jgi:hypothetical protein